MTKLLVSVVSAAEARIALDGGAHLIDVKDPQKGSLGAPDSVTLQNVITEVARRAPVSVALGELRDSVSMGDLKKLGDVEYAKLGMAGLACHADWPERWSEALRRLPPEVRPVAVAYADWRAVGAPEPAQILIEAERVRCAAVLVDTCDKSAGRLLDWWDLDSLGRFTASIQRQGMRAVLAGSLGMDTAPVVASLRPDYIAVRGAVCDGGRTGPLVEGRVRSLARMLAELVGQAFQPDGRSSGWKA
jgi:(5-formylfuran-3-yl)methyl phosphate synthase